MDTAVGYIRVSTDKDKQKNSLAAQPETIRRYAEMAGLTLMDIVQDEVSALKVPFFDRESGKAIREMIKKKEVQHVIGAKVDRLFRDAQDGLATADWMVKHGASLHVIDTGGVINVGDPAGRMMFTMLLAVAEFEPRRISQRTKEALGVLRKSGKVVGKIPYGKILNADNTISEDPQKISVVAEIKQRVADGEQLGKIAANLNERGIPTECSGKMIKYRGVQKLSSGKWHASTIRQIARRPDVQL
jgi:site-specific DNA recombinase